MWFCFPSFTSGRHFGFVECAFNRKIVILLSFTVLHTAHIFSLTSDFSFNWVWRVKWRRQQADEDNEEGQNQVGKLDIINLIGMSDKHSIGFKIIIIIEYEQFTQR